MKKGYLLIICILIVSLLFAACGNQSDKKLENIKAALVGGEFKGDNGIAIRTYSFRADGTYLPVLTNPLGTTSGRGTYEVTNDAIVLCNQSGEYIELKYTYNSDNGNIVLYSSTWNMTFTKK